LPDGIFQTKTRDLGKFWRGLNWKIMVFYMVIWYILSPFGIFNGYKVYVMAIWYIFPCLGIFIPFCQEKSGNPGM
jgi:hypothetical protein